MATGTKRSDRAHEGARPSGYAQSRFEALRANGLPPMLFLAPAVIALVVLTLYPLIYGLRLSFGDYDLLRGMSAGAWTLENYTSLFTDGEFLSALRLTVVFVIVAVSVQLLLGFGLALLLSQRIPGRAIARTAIISAMVLTPVVVGTAWRLMYSPELGLVNYFTGLVGLEPQAFLSEPRLVIPALIAVDTWQWTPLMMLILLAGLQSLPTDVYEAAQVEGAGPLQTFWHITLPLLKPAIAVAVLIRTIDCYRTFDIIYAMTGGGPGTISQNLNIFAYYAGFEFFDISGASAVAVTSLVVITVICTLIVRGFGVELWKSNT
jgi:multiple sugar transport system permease protein